jgi:hypothetical protein
MPAAKARILHGHITLFLWKIINIEEKLTIQDLFDHIVDHYVPQLKEKVIEKIIVCCSILKEQTGDKIELECIASDVINIFGNLFTFYIKLFSDENNPQPVNAFDILKMLLNNVIYLFLIFHKI